MSTILTSVLVCSFIALMWFSVFLEMSDLITNNSDIGSVLSELPIKTVNSDFVLFIGNFDFSVFDLVDDAPEVDSNPSSDSSLNVLPLVSKSVSTIWLFGDFIRKGLSRFVLHCVGILLNG